jgi:hypothetical protein
MPFKELKNTFYEDSQAGKQIYYLYYTPNLTFLLKSNSITTTYFIVRQRMSDGKITLFKKLYFFARTKLAKRVPILLLLNSLSSSAIVLGVLSDGYCPTSPSIFGYALTKLSNNS